MDINNTINYYTFSIKQDKRFKNLVLQYKLDKYKHIVEILMKCNYQQDNKVMIDELFNDINKYEDELLKIELEEMFRKQKVRDEMNTKLKNIRLKKLYNLDYLYV